MTAQNTPRPTDGRRPDPSVAQQAIATLKILAVAACVLAAIWLLDVMAA